ncbi:type II toxin-antitoxin system RelE/ParE family toxin [Allopusillimonas ginsengisoli]|nr:type II toxin-antitoxin system RelE/ParE family toxin [Allopusillimonas ginsengisoli]
MYQVLDYISPEGHDPFIKWLTGLADRQARARILTRLNRLAGGNFGDCKPIYGGVWELRIKWGAGYRVYYAQAGKQLILLLAGGDKRTQKADINAAILHWQEWQNREKTS